MKRSESGDRTFDSIRDRYESWRDDNPPPASKSALGISHLPVPELAPATARVVFSAVGIGIGLLLLALAAYSFWVAVTWTRVFRDGAVTGYALIGLFLAIAGLAAVFGTWNHFFRVLKHRPTHH